MNTIEHYTLKDSPAARTDATRAVERRASTVLTEIESQLRKLDMKLPHAVPGELGPLVSRLRALGGVRPLVFGLFGETNSATRDLIKCMGHAQHAAFARRMGRTHSNQAANESAFYLKSQLAIANTRARAQCLIDRADSILASPSPRSSLHPDHSDPRDLYLRAHRRFEYARRATHARACSREERS